MEKNIDGMRSGGKVSGEHRTFVVGNIPHEVEGSERVEPELSSVEVYEVGGS